MNDEKIEIVNAKYDELKSEMCYALDRLEVFLSFLQVDEKHKYLYDEGLKVLGAKYKRVKKADSIEDLNKVIKVKKLIKEYKPYRERR